MFFSACFVVIVHSEKAKGSFENLTREVKRLVKEISECAVPWVEEKVIVLKDRFTDPTSIKINVDVKAQMPDRILRYFYEAFKAVGEKRYELEAARSQTCFLLLNGAIRELIATGLIKAPPETTSRFVKEAFQNCEEISAEIKATLQRHLK